jgi:hypothetical protein
MAQDEKMNVDKLLNNDGDESGSTDEDFVDDNKSDRDS